MKQDNVKVLLVEVARKPRIVTINNSVQALKELVGEHLEFEYPWKDPVTLVCDDQGWLNGKYPNRMLNERVIIPGDFILVEHDLIEGEIIDLSPDMAAKYMKRFYYPELIIPGEKEPIAIKLPV